MNNLFALKDLGDLSYFLGIEVHGDSDSLHLCQHKYFQDLLQRANMSSCKSSEQTQVFSMASGTILSARDGDPLPDPKQYCSLVGALQYCTITRPDLSFVVNKACQFLHAPTTVHWNLVECILHYLKTTSHLGLPFTSSGPLSLTSYTDVNWANCPDDHRNKRILYLSWLKSCLLVFNEAKGCISI